jgi:hypothetical protein
MKIKKSHISLSLLIIIFTLTIVNIKYPILTPQDELENLQLSAGEITVITPENKTYAEPMNGYYPATYGFEDEIDGQSGTAINFIDGLSASAYCLIHSNFDPLGIDNHNKVLEFQSTGDPHFAYHQLSSQENAGIVEFYINFDEANENHTFGLYETTDYLDGAIQISWRDNGYLSYYDGSWNNIETYSSNIWYHVKIEFNVSDDWHLWIDEVQKDSSGYSYLGSISHVEYLWIAGSSTADIKFDAFGYSWAPFYTIGDNLKEGLLLSYSNTTNLDWKGYSLDGQVNETISGNATIPMPVEGIHMIQIFGNDTIGTMYNSSVQYFSVNIAPLELTINSPNDSETFGTSAPVYDISIIGLYEEMWYTLDNGVTNISISGLTGAIDQSEWDKLGDGIVTIAFYANNSAGMIDSDVVQVIKSTSVQPPPGIPGYDIIALLGVSFVVTLLIMKKRNI